MPCCEAAEGCDVVFHVAAKAGIWGSYREYYRANVAGTENVIAACRRTRHRRLVYTSSPSVVFDGRDVEGGDESLPYPDHYEAHYPQTKAEAERLVLAANSAELATVSLRPHLIWGPGDNHLVPRIIAKGAGRAGCAASATAPAWSTPSTSTMPPRPTCSPPTAWRRALPSRARPISSPTASRCRCGRW